MAVKRAKVNATMSEIRNNSALWVPWVLECGCEACVEHCSQCDERRKIKTAWQEEDKIKRTIDWLHSLGYAVYKPTDR